MTNYISVFNIKMKLIFSFDYYFIFDITQTKKLEKL